MHRRTLLVAALGLLAVLGSQPLRASDARTLFAQPPASSAPTLAFEDAAVEVAGLKPGGQLAWFSLTYEHEGYEDFLIRREDIETDADADGAVRIEVERGIWTKSVWAVVDLAGGGFALAVPPHSPLAPSEFPLQGLVLGALGQLNRFEDRREAVEVFYARPGTGAWRLTVRDGGGEDADGAENGGLAVQLDEAEPIGLSPPAPQHLLPGDVVVVIDPKSFEFFALQLPGGLPQTP